MLVGHAGPAVEDNEGGGRGGEGAADGVPCFAWFIGGRDRERESTCGDARA